MNIAPMTGAITTIIFQKLVWKSPNGFNLALRYSARNIPTMKAEAVCPLGNDVIAKVTLCMVSTSAWPPKHRIQVMECDSIFRYQEGSKCREYVLLVSSTTQRWIREYTPRHRWCCGWTEPSQLRRIRVADGNEIWAKFAFHYCQLADFDRIES